jgi:hypothetical protein
MQEQISTLESQLQEKEQLVSALTERLEQAAEQLDRLHRTGADKALRVGGGIPPELIEEQKQLVEELQHAVQQWEDMQPGALLGRIEFQLTEIRDLVANGSPGGYVASGSTGDRPVPQNGSKDGGREVEVHSRESGGSASAYEALKAGLLAHDPPAGGDEPHDDVQEEQEELRPEVAEQRKPEGPEFEEKPLADPPATLDVENASTDDLKSGIEERDSYILYLLQRLRQAEARHVVRNDWKTLEEMPTELRVRLEVLEKQLEQTLRTAEVELSLQRAKLGREEARIRQLDDQVQKELKRAGMQGADTDEEGSVSDKGISGRWMRMLGRRKSDD